ncbi:MAG: hydrolase [Solirubrobacterales bacterium]
MSAPPTDRTGAASERLDRGRAALVVVDVQEAFRKAIPAFDAVARAVATLVRGAAAMEVPVIVTEQYPKGLGTTVPEVSRHLPPGTRPVEKVRFSAAEAEGFDLDGRDQAILCGIEAHVCVNQTTLDLLARGVEVYLVGDAVGSRTDANRELGIERARRAGAAVSSVEMALFELLGGSDAPEFSEVQALVK